jgi:dihydroorotate dehydrogenase (NAD+) catalytic subunit
MPSMTDVDLSVDLGRGLRLRSPVMVASGTFGYGFDAPQVDRSALGAIVTKGTTPRPRAGNAPTRIAETPSGLLNAIGLQNPGVDHVAREYAPKWAAWDVPVIVNVAGDSV